MFTVIAIAAVLIICAVSIFTRKYIAAYYLAVLLSTTALFIGLLIVPSYYGYSVPTELTYIEEAIVLYVHDENQGYNILLMEKGLEKPRLIFLDRSNITQSQIDDIRERMNNGSIVIISTKPSTDSDGDGSNGMTGDGNSLRIVENPTMLGK